MYPQIMYMDEYKYIQFTHPYYLSLSLSLPHCHIMSSFCLRCHIQLTHRITREILFLIDGNLLSFGVKVSMLLGFRDVFFLMYVYKGCCSAKYWYIRRGNSFFNSIVTLLQLYLFSRVIFV